MFITIPDKEKSLYTHASLLEDDKADKIKKIYHGVNKWVNGSSFLAFFVTMEAVNRISFLKKQDLWKRALVVAVPILAVRFLVPMAYWKISGNQEIKRICDGAPVFNNIADVPELDKMYFYLDDDNNYEPSLWHHGM